MNENLDLRVEGRYRVLRKLGRGTFGVVYEALDLETDEKVAIKLEPLTIEDPSLESEVEVFKDLSGRAGIPRIYANGEDGDYRYMFLELLGPSLADLQAFCGGTFSLKTVLMLADQLVHRLEILHRQNIVHRDIKPQNFLMGLGRQGNVIYLIDFGLSVYAHPPPTDLLSRKPETIGTSHFASVSGHVGFGRCRCDDLESLGYVFLDLLRGSLPWDKVKGNNETQTAKLLLEHKQSVSTGELCAGLPKAFATYFHHIRSHRSDDKPSYSYLRKIFQRLFLREGFEHDGVYDWTVLKFLQMRRATTAAEAEAEAAGAEAAVADSL